MSGVNTRILLGTTLNPSTPPPPPPDGQPTIHPRHDLQNSNGRSGPATKAKQRYLEILLHVREAR